MRHQELMFDEIGRIASRNPESRKQFATTYGAPVYELSDVAKLFDGDWQDHLGSEIVKRPPHDKLWCEWEASGGDEKSYVTMRHGMLLTKATDSLRRTLINASDPSDAELIARHRGFNPSADGTNHYVARHFMKLVKGRSSSGRVTMPVGVIFQIPIIVHIVFSEDFSRVTHGFLPCGEGFRDIAMFGVTIAHPECIDPRVYMSFAGGVWPAIMSFALLHCKNVMTETVSAPGTPKKMIQRGYPPRVSYKVLKIEVPANRKLKTELTGEELAENTGPKVRWHLVRGHFATMHHERFKNRGGTYWVPAHWKGDAGLGTVVKDYKPVPAR